MKKIKTFWHLLYTLNHPDTPLYPITLFERYYKFRIGFKTAWALAILISKQIA
jgi:hypothetical protein